MEASKESKFKNNTAGSSNLQEYGEYNGLLPLLQRSFEDSKSELENLMALNVDLDYYDDMGTICCTPLYYAVGNRLEKWTIFLLDNGADTALASVENEDGSVTTLSDIAWSHGDYHIVLRILLADGPLPKYFNAEKFTVVQSLKYKALRFENNQLHTFIKLGSIKEVAAFIEKFPQLRHAYDINNKSALTIALECRSFEIYVFLRINGFKCGVDSEHDKLFEMIKKNEKYRKTLDKEMKKYVQSSDIFSLLSKSLLGVYNDKKHFDKLKLFFQELEKFEEIKPILAFLANEKFLTIIFDFNHSDIRSLDLFNRTCNARGRTFSKGNKILIAAKQESEKEVLGILIQELAHFTMLKVYNNKFLPYRAGDEVHRVKFSLVLKECYSVKDREEIIANAFEYDVTEIEAELIARVPQMIVQNHQKKLSKNRKTFEKLFEYYKGVVLKDIEKEISLIKQKQKVQELNEHLGILHRLKKEKLRVSKTKAALFDFWGVPGNVFIQSKLPEIVLSNMVHFFKFSDSENVFVEFEQIKANLPLFEDITDAGFIPTVFIMDSSDKEFDNFPEIMNIIEKTKIVFISIRCNRPYRDIYQNYMEVDFVFADLSKVSREELLDSRIWFQGSEIELKKLFDNDLEEVETWPLEDVLSASRTKFNDFEKFFPKVSGIFIARSFQSDDNDNLLNIDDLISELDNNKTVIISDKAGMVKLLQL